MHKELVVIGGGPAGITLAKRLAKKHDMAVIRPEDYSMIYCAMPYVIEGILPMEKTFKKDALVTDAGAELIRDTVSSVDFENKSITFVSGNKLSWEKLVIATGAIPFIPPVKGSDLKGITGFKKQEDMEKIASLCDKGLKTAVIVGAGAIGIELAQALQEKGVQVHLIDMADSVLANMNDKEMTVESYNALAAQGINITLGAKVEAFEGKEYVEKVILDNGRRISFETSDSCSEGSEETRSLVVFAAGVRPELSFLSGSPLEIGRDGIHINEYMETNIKDVYACGDCAEFTSGITGEIMSGKLATNAVPMAKILAANLSGQKRKYPGFFNGAATKTGNFYIGGTGMTEKSALARNIEVITGYSESTTQFPIMPGAKPLKVKLIARKDNGKIIGGQVLSGEPVTSKIDVITFAVQMKATAYDMQDLSYSAQPYQSFFPAANAIVLAAEQITKKT